MSTAGTITIPASPPARSVNPDRIGIVASVLCAIHCAITPFLLLFAPSFAEIWAHPASHWLVALFVVPLAALMVARGFRKHRRAWVVSLGIAGISLVLAGAALPYMKSGNPASAADPASATAEPTATESSSSTPVTASCCKSSGPKDPQTASSCCNSAPTATDTPTATAATASATTASEPADTCCPSLAVDEAGNTRLNIPAASIVTTLGGILLIATHVGNLCVCPSCRKCKIA